MVVGAETLKLRVTEVMDNRVGYAPMLPKLLGQIPVEEKVLSVRSNGPYDTQICHEGHHPAKGRDSDSDAQEHPAVEGQEAGAVARYEILQITNRLGRANWRKLSNCHRRLLVETKMRYFKRLGERVFEQQVVGCRCELRC